MLMRISVILWLTIVVFSCKNDQVAPISEIPYPLLFTLQSGSNYDIVVINNNLSQTRLTDGGFNVAPSWSPDGSKIAYWTNTSGGLDEIMVMNEDGTGKINLTNSAGWYEERPVWSPNGSFIAYDVLRNQYGVGVMQADGSDQRFVAAGERYSNIVWTSDGSTLIFNKRQGALLQIFSVAIDGTLERRLTQDTTKSYSSPTVSPDGRYLTFLENIGGGISRIILRELTMGIDTTISTNGSGVRWSFDSQWIYYTERTDRGFVMRRVRPDGTSNENLSARVSFATYDDNVQSVTPQGEKIAFTSNRTGMWGIYIMNANGSNQQLILEVPNATTTLWRPR